MAYHVRVLGGLQVQHDDVPLGWVVTQRVRTALLVFLAVERHATRAHLSHLLWPDEEPDHARHALSQTLYLLRHALGEGVIEAHGETVRIADAVCCDAVEFAAVAGCANADGALDLYRGPFLAGVTLSESREYEAWVDQQRARLARLHRKLRRECLEELAAGGRTQDALEAARGWVLAEPFDDEAQHRLIELLAASGQRTEALQQYDIYLRLLEGEELQPLEDTRSLVQHLRAGDGAQGGSALPAMAFGIPPPAVPIDSVTAVTGAIPEHAGVATRPLRRGLVAGLLFVLLVVSWWVWVGRQPTESVRLAVLPFENVTGDRDDQYLVDGLTEAVSANLGMLEDLHVLSGAAGYASVAGGRGVGEWAPALGATHVLQGTMEVAGEQVRIATRVLRADSGQVVHSREYRGRTNELFRLDDDVARDVADALDVRVNREVRARIARQPTSSVRAYELYQRGRFLLNQWNRAGLDSAIVVLEQAVEEDYFFAAARAELANAYNEKADIFAPGDSLREKAFVSIQTALLLDPDLAEAHVAYGNMVWTEEYNFPHRMALERFRRAAELQPSSSTVHDRLSLVYVHIGLLDLALHEAQLGVELNPGDHLARFRVGLTLATQQRYADALRELRNFPPEVAPVRLPLIGESLLYLGRPDEALAVLDSADAAEPGDPWILSTRALVLATRGDTAAALRDIEATLPLLPDRMHAHHGEFNVGLTYAALGLTHLALPRLERAARNGWPCYPRYAGDPILARTLAGDPRYEALMTWMKAEWEAYRRDYPLPKPPRGAINGR